MEPEFYEFLGGLPEEPVELEPELVELFQSSLNVRLGSTARLPEWLAAMVLKKRLKAGAVAQ